MYKHNEREREVNDSVLDWLCSDNDISIYHTHILAGQFENACIRRKGCYACLKFGFRLYGKSHLVRNY